jgi:hypothetical protein
LAERFRGGLVIIFDPPDVTASTDSTASDSVEVALQMRTVPSVEADSMR